MMTRREYTETDAATPSLLHDEQGQDLLEYGMLAALIAVVAVAAVGTLGNKIHTVLWQYIVSSNV